MTQFARPISDVSATGTWVPASNRWAQLDEVVPDDTTTIAEIDLEFSLTVLARLEVKFSSINTPGNRLNHVLKFRIASGGGTSIRSGNQNISIWRLNFAKLKQGAVTIATFPQTILATANQLDGINCYRADPLPYTTYTLNLTESEANSITDYSDLRIEVEFELIGGFLCVGNGQNTNVGTEYTWAEFSAPDADNDTPTGLLATASGFYKNNLSWVAPVNPGVTSYRIERGDGPSPGSNFVQIAEVTILSHIDLIAISVPPPGAPPNYCYRVRAVRSTGVSAPSNVSCTTLSQAVGNNVISVACPVNLPYNRETADSTVYTTEVT